MNRAGYTWAFLAAVTWGLAYCIEGRIVARYSAIGYMVARAIVYVVLAVPVLCLMPRSGWIAPLRDDPWPILGLSALWTVGTYFIVRAEQAIGASRANAIEILYPVFTVGFAFLFWRERLSVTFYLGLALALAGAVLVVIGGRER